MRFSVAVTLLIFECAPVTPAGVSTPVNIADPHRYNELTPGVSTTGDSIRTLGDPNSYAAMPQGQTLLQWMQFRGAHGIHLAILFSADGRMIRVQQVTVL
jgi:hypothetical protein